MDPAKENTYFNLIPIECLIEILKHVNTEDIINFCDCYAGFEYLLQESSLTSKLNLPQYWQHDIKQISAKINPTHVTALNVNGCHWIPANVLRSFIGKLVNLKQLTALRTKLCFCEDDMRTYRKTNLEKLALTPIDHSNWTIGSFPTITTLGLELPISGCGYDIGRFPNLEKVWIEADSYAELHLLLRRIFSSKLRKIVISTKSTVTGLDFTPPELRRYYVGSKECQPQIACFEMAQTELILPPMWKFLEHVHAEMPFGPKDARKLYLGQNTLDDIRFQELNFHHRLCLDEVREIFKKILQSANASHVQKLAFPSCLFNDSNEQDKSTETITRGFKRKRIGINNRSGSHDNVFDNLKDLRHLELYSCPRGGALGAYHSVATFTQLKYLYVEIPRTNDGNFLLEVSKKCIHLETLWIDSRNANDIINYNTRKALESCTKLTEFTLKNVRLKISDLLNLLITLKHIKLRKLCLMCESSDAFSTTLLSEYVTNNAQLMYCLLQITSLTKKQQRDIKKVVNAVKMKHTVFVICDDPHRLPHVNVDVKGMREFKSGTCSLNLQEDFGTF